MDNELARMTAAVLSVTFTAWTRPTNVLALANSPAMFVPFGGLYSTVTANPPRSRTSFKRRELSLIFTFYEAVSTLAGRSFRRFERVVEQHRDRHRYYSAGNRRNPACTLADGIKIHIADEFAVRKPIRPDVDDYGTFTDHVCRYKARFAD